jgi:hypothetical protein
MFNSNANSVLCLQICRKNKIFFHSDLAQMAGKTPVNVDDLNIDLASISSHKVQCITNSISCQPTIMIVHYT